MVKFADDCEVIKMAPEGEYLFRIYEVNEKVSQAGNIYWQIKFETKEGVKVCDNFMFNGKGAFKTLCLFTALGLADGEEFPTDNITEDDILGKFLYINTVKDKDSDFLKCPFKKDGYRPYEGKKTKAKKVEVDTEDIPF